MNCPVTKTASEKTVSVQAIFPPRMNACAGQSAARSIAKGSPSNACLSDSCDCEHCGQDPERWDGME